MKKTIAIFTIATLLAVPILAGTTITYSYDARHRLVAADYAEAQPDTHVTYQYDAANNVELIAAITDSQWLQSFMIWLASVWDGNREPRMNTNGHLSACPAQAGESEA